MKNEECPDAAPGGAELVETQAEEAGAAAAGEQLLELILAEHAAQGEHPDEPIHGVVIGWLVGIGPGGEPLVDFPGRAGGGPVGLPARAMTTVAAGDSGREVALLFEGGDRRRPVVMGLMHVPCPMPAAGEEAAAPEPKVVPEGAPPAIVPTPQVEADGERLVLTAEREIVLRVGKASITLTRAGKVLIHGAYLLARSSGVNRIQGGSVQIN